MLIRKATNSDISAIEQIYSDIHTSEENGEVTIGWIRGVYPTRSTAQAALSRGDLFVAEADGAVVGAAVINRIQVEEYSQGNWEYEAANDEIMVLHTLVISPKKPGKGYGRKFVEYYERYALENGCLYLRIDTNELNIRARTIYKKLGYKEIGTVPCDFNGIKNVKMVLLEKKIGEI